MYNGWGNNSVAILDTTATTIANLNPFRYRSYYLDTETNLYFLKTRYYDSEIGRFMTIDGVSYLNPDSINGLNLYAYCGNNPVMKFDPDGHFSIMSLGIVVLGSILLGGIVSGIAAGAAGGSVGDVFAGIGKGMLNTAVFVASSIIVLKSFSAPGGVSGVAGSLMLTYGISVMINMLDVCVVQGKKSASDGDDLWMSINDINNATFSNLPGVLLGKLSIDGIQIIGTKLFSKVTLLNKFITAFIGNLTVWSFAKAFSITNNEFWSGGNKMGLVMGLLFLIPSFIRLAEDIIKEPDYDDSSWILY